MSTLKVDTIRPVTTDGSLTLQGDASGTGVTGLVIDSTGTVTTGTLGSGVVFPTGHVLRTFSDSYDFTSGYTITTTGSTFADLDIEVSSPSTSDELLFSLFLPDVYNETAVRWLKVSFRYSTDNWASSTSLHDAVASNVNRFDDLKTMMNSFQFTGIINHPTSSTYRIRPYLQSVNGNVVIGFGGDSYAYLVAQEIKG